MSKLRSLFFTEKERKIYESCGRELIENIIGSEILLYQVNIQLTNAHQLYGESKRKEWTGPFTIKGRIFRDDKDTFMEGGIRRLSKRQIRFMVYLKALEEQNLVIKNGDLIFDDDFWFEVYDPGYGHQLVDYPVDWNYYLIVYATQVTKDVFEGK